MKTTKLLALSSALLWSAAAFAQSPAPTGSGSSETSSTTTTTTTTTVPAIVPSEGSGIVSDAEPAGAAAESTDGTLPATGGAPLLMALSGLLAAGGAFVGLKKVR